MISYLIIAFFVYGVSAVIDGFDEFFGLDLDFRYHHRMDEIGPTEQKKWIQFIMRPTVHCSVCMSSFWGVIGYLLYFQSFDLIPIVFHCIISAAIITIINRYS
jgi:hypothetical protein